MTSLAEAQAEDVTAVLTMAPCADSEAWGKALAANGTLHVTITREIF